MNSQEKTLRPSSRYWKQDIGGIVLFLIIFPIAAMLYFGEEMYVVGGFALIVGIPYLISEVRIARRQQITFSKLDIVVKIRKDDLRQSWESIKAVKFVGQGQSRLLVLYCGEHNLNIPCRFYDEIELMENLKGHLSSIVLHPQAYQKLPEFSDWQESITQKLSEINRPLKVSLRSSEKWVGVFCISLGILFGCLSFFSKADAIPIIMIGSLFGGIGLLWLLLPVGWIEGDNNTISVRTIFRKVDFSWNELRKVYINSDRGVLALVGDHSRLIVPSCSDWLGKDKDLLYDLMSLKIELSKLEPLESGKPLYWRSKNA